MGELFTLLSSCPFKLWQALTGPVMLWGVSGAASKNISCMAPIIFIVNGSFKMMVLSCDQICASLLRTFCILCCLFQKISLSLPSSESSFTQKFHISGTKLLHRAIRAVGKLRHPIRGYGGVSQKMIHKLRHLVGG